MRQVPQLASSVKLRAKQLLARAGGRFKTQSKSGLPSEAWFKGFKSRWTVQLKTPSVLNRARAKAEEPEVIKSLFSNVVAIAKAKNILPARWFGADETGFGEAKGRMRAKVAVPAGMPNPKLVSGDYFNQHLSLMLGMDTKGRYICPMFIFQVTVVYVTSCSVDVYSTGKNVFVIASLRRTPWLPIRHVRSALATHSRLFCRLV